MTLSGDWLRKKREKAGLSLRQLADLTYLTSTHLHDVENGRRSLSLEAEDRVRAALKGVK
jgi:transcriptional regulator with XRE-family HTH domain